MRAVGSVWVLVALCGCDDGSGRARPLDATAPRIDAGRSPGDATAPDQGPPDAVAPDAEPVDAGCPVAFAYDPIAGARLETFPDDYYTEEDPESPTGLRVRFDAENAPWLPEIVGGYSTVFGQLGALDGFGTTAGIILRFDGAVGPVPDDALRLWEMAAPAPKPIPVEIERTDDDATLIAWPMRPLRPGAPHALVVTSALSAAGGGCVDPGPTLRALLDGRAGDPRLARLAARYAELPALAEPELVVAAAVFTTQTIVEASLAVAADVRGRAFAWEAPPICVDGALFRQCDGAFVAGDYRREGGVADTPAAQYTLPVRVWLPREGSPPFPTVVFGHGLGSGRGQGAALAEVAAPLGIATVAIDAVAHGDHPTSPGDNELERLTAFFGIDLRAQRLDALVLRDNFRQSTYDKLQLLRLIASAPDVDGDGTSDLDVGHVVYLGVSLGGIMGSELAALTPDLGAVVLSVPGGRVASIISDAPQFAILVRAMTPPGTPLGEVDRFFPVLQTLLERGDAANYAPYVLRDRLPGAGARPPHLLFQMAIDDQIVPNVCNRALARALGVPQVPPVLQPVGLVPVAAAPPVRANLLDGETTAGLYQFDRVTRRPGEAPVRAEHGNVPASQEALRQAARFIESWLDSGVAEIIDPR